MEDGLAIIDVKTMKVLYLNQFYTTMFGYTIKDFNNDGVNLWLEKCVHPDFRSEREKYIKSRSWPVKSSFKVISRHGEERWLEQAVTTRVINQRKCAVLILRDVTKLKNTETSLKLLTESIKSAQETISICVFEPEKKWIYHSRGVETTTGLSVKKWLADPDFGFKNNILHSDDVERAKKYFSTKKFPSRYNMRYLTKNGEYNLVEVSTFKKKILDIVYYGFICRDITEHSEIEKTKNEKNKLELKNNKLDIAKKLKQQGVDGKIISVSTGISYKEIMKL